MSCGFKSHPSQKSFAIGSAGFKLDNIKDELDKCELVCSNCHRRRTAKRGNHYRWRLSQEIEGEEKI